MGDLDKKGQQTALGPGRTARPENGSWAGGQRTVGGQLAPDTTEAPKTRAGRVDQKGIGQGTRLLGMCMRDALQRDPSLRNLGK